MNAVVMQKCNSNKGIILHQHFSFVIAVVIVRCIELVSFCFRHPNKENGKRMHCMLSFVANSPAES